MYKQDLALNNQQRLLCHKIKANQTNHTSIKSIVIPYFLSRFLRFPRGTGGLKYGSHSTVYRQFKMPFTTKKLCARDST